VAQGTVLRWFDSKGYGFIRPNDGSVDVFVHASQLRSIGLSMLTEGTVIEFDTAPSPRSNREMAVNIRVIKETVS